MISYLFNFLFIIQGSSERELDSTDSIHQPNVYDQIYYDNIQSNSHGNSSLLMKYSDSIPPYTPCYSSDDSSTDHYYYHLPSSSILIDQETIPIKPTDQSTSNTKRELHKELIYRQKM